MTYEQFQELVYLVGWYFLWKWVDRLKESNATAVATQMRKQGIPLDMTLRILLGRSERFSHLNGSKA